MTSIFQAGQPFNLVRTSSATYQASDKDLVISSGDEVALPSPNQGATVLVRPAPSTNSVKITTSNGTIGNTGDTFGIYRATEPIYLVGDGTNWYARSGGGEISAIPDTQITRGVDDAADTVSVKTGFVFNPNVELDGLKAEISSQTSGATTAYIETTGNSIVGQTDISSLSSGDTVLVTTSSPLQSGTDYLFLLDANGSSFDQGFLNSSAYPYVGSAFDITERAFNGSPSGSGTFNAFNNIRNLNY